MCKWYGCIRIWLKNVINFQIPWNIWNWLSASDEHNCCRDIVIICWKQCAVFVIARMLWCDAVWSEDLDDPIAFIMSVCDTSSEIPQTCRRTFIWLYGVTYKRIFIPSCKTHLRRIRKFARSNYLLRHGFSSARVERLSPDRCWWKSMVECSSKICR
jgi:hypothetical protein